MWRSSNRHPLSKHVLRSEPRCSRPMLERMETRRMLASTVTGVLTVTGTKASDTIVIRLNENDDAQLDVTINGDAEAFQVENIESIEVFGLEGRDTITISDANGVIEIEAFVGGGHANDTLTSGSGDSTLNGGNGDDVLVGGAGDDELEGGRDTDSLTGGEGEDVFKSSDTTAEVNDNTEGEDGVQIPLADAPQPVRDRINRLLATETGTRLTGLFEESDEGNTVYEAEFDQRRFDRSLKIFPDGTLEEDETELEIDFLPGRIRRAVLGAHPDAEITEAELRLFARRVFYEVEIEVGDEVREVILTERGRIVEDNLEA